MTRVSQHDDGKGFHSTVGIALAMSAIIIIATAGLGRAVHNIQGALTGKPDLAVYLLLPDLNVSSVTLLRGGNTKRDYLVETDEGLKLVVLELKEGKWTLTSTDDLRGTADSSAARATGTR
jgi:hypothetical protein